MASSSSSSRFPSTAFIWYDVFLSFGGEDVRKNFVDHLYSTLVDRQFRIYKDDERHLRGESIGPSLFRAIDRSRIAIIIFSKNYANSSWCLDELTHIMKCRDVRDLTVIPMFYDVEPIEVIRQTGKFGESFDKQVAKNVTKAEVWKKALTDVSHIKEWGPEYISYRRLSLGEQVYDEILYMLPRLNTHVEEDLVGMRERIKDLISLFHAGWGGVRMIGIWGVGGSGKTALATSVYKRISEYFQGDCIIKNVREKTSKYGLNKLQENILSALFKEEVKVHRVAEGKDKMKSMLRHSSVLILLDDVDKLDQLEALAGKHSWFGSGSRIIITTRDEHLLRTHQVDRVYPVKLLSHDEVTWLFNRHAYNEEEPVEDYEKLSSIVVSCCDGLPLAIKVLGSFLYDKNKTQWSSAIDQLKDFTETEIVEKLKISFDGLKSEEELFLDIACFFRRSGIDDAMEMLEACGYHSEIGIKVLMQKALITIVDGKFDMHDLVQEMGHYIVRGEDPYNPGKHTRVWKDEEIKQLCFGDVTKENDKTEAIRYNGYSYDHSSRFCNTVSNMKKLRLLQVSMEDKENEEVDEYDGGPSFLSNLLSYIDWKGYPASPFPDSFQPTRLAVLKLDTSKQNELWMGYKHLPNLKVLELRHMNRLLSTPDFDGLPCLQKLILCHCEELQEIHPSLGNHISLEYLIISNCPKLIMFPKFVHMKSLKTLKIADCGLEDGEIPHGIGELYNLRELDLSMNTFSRLDFSLWKLTQLKVLNLLWCNNLIELPELPTSLEILKADYCSSLTTLGDCYRNCRQLYHVSLMGGGIINDGKSLLQSMPEGVAIENRSMLLQIKDLEIRKRFTPPLRRGGRCKLELPNKWPFIFCGFLMCAVFSYDFHRSDSVWISMNEVNKGGS